MIHLKSLISASIEGVLNAWLYRSSVLRRERYRLKSKVIRISLKNFLSPIILVFSEKKVDVLCTWKGKIDCSILIDLSTLEECTNYRKLISLIRNGNLELEGDLQVLQNFFLLTSLIELDPTELLVPYIGDVASEGVKRLFIEHIILFFKKIKRCQRYISEILIEEWRLASGPLEVSWFIEETNILQLKTDLLKRKIEKLEIK